MLQCLLCLNSSGCQCLAKLRPGTIWRDTITRVLRTRITSCWTSQHECRICTSKETTTLTHSGRISEASSFWPWLDAKYTIRLGKATSNLKGCFSKGHQQISVSIQQNHRYHKGIQSSHPPETGSKTYLQKRPVSGLCIAASPGDRITENARRGDTGTSGKKWMGHTIGDSAQK